MISLKETMDRNSPPPTECSSVSGKKKYHFLSGKTKVFLASSMILFGAVLAYAVPSPELDVPEETSLHVEKNLSRKSASKRRVRVSSEETLIRQAAPKKTVNTEELVKTVPEVAAVLAEPKQPYAAQVQAPQVEAATVQPSEPYGKYEPPPVLEDNASDSKNLVVSSPRGNNDGNNTSARPPITRIDERAVTKKLDELPPMEKWSSEFDKRPPLSENTGRVLVLKSEFSETAKARDPSRANLTLMRSDEWAATTPGGKRSGGTVAKIKAEEFEPMEAHRVSPREIVSRKPPIEPDRTIHENPPQPKPPRTIESVVGRKTIILMRKSDFE